MPTETRDVPTGTVTDADQLQLELLAAADLIGTTCESVAIFSGAPDDTIEMMFVGVADDTELDNVIAAHPSYTAGLTNLIALTENVFATIWERPLQPGERLKVAARLHLEFGDASDLEVANINFDAVARRRTGEAAFVASGGAGSGLTEHGEIPQVQARLVASGNLAQLQIATRRTATATINGLVNIDSRVA